MCVWSSGVCSSDLGRKGRVSRAPEGAAYRMLTDTVREPAVEKGFVGGPRFGEVEVAFALKRLDRLDEHGLAAAPAMCEQRIERGERFRPDRAIAHEIGIIDRKSTRLNSRP